MNASFAAGFAPPLSGSTPSFFKSTEPLVAASSACCRASGRSTCTQHSGALVVTGHHFATPNATPNVGLAVKTPAQGLHAVLTISGAMLA
eukprot:COSAG04_NODE_130_length_24323_cov_50.932835_27_plen_90_part_00